MPAFLSSRPYLFERVALNGPACLLLAYATYAALRLESVSSSFTRLLLFGLWIGSFMKAPRAILYAGLLLLTISTTSHQVHEVALGPHNAGADRDDAVVVGANALLAHQNPWSMRTQLDNPLTTGPTSFLIGLPFVAATGDVTSLTFLFWILLVAAVLFIDVGQQSSQFPLAALIIHVGLFAIEHSQRWRLEELSFGNLLFLPAAWCAVSKRRPLWLLAGALSALTICVRPSYVFALMAFALWAVWTPERSWRRTGLLAAGAAAGLLGMLSVIRVLSETSIIELYRSYASVMRELIESGWPPWPKGDPLYGALNWVAKKLNRFHLGRRPSLRIAVPMLALLGVLIPITLRHRPSHPWWYITFAQLVAFGLASRVGNGLDYALPVVSAALIALVYIPREAGA